MCVLLLAMAAVAVWAAAAVDARAAPGHRSSPARPDAATVFQKSLPTEEVWAVRGMDVDLPCNVTARKGDHVDAIFWYFGTSGIPLSSLDARATELSRAEHLTLAGAPAGTSGMGGRVFLRAQPPPATTLRLTNVTASDEGEFRCRIDFRNSPTANRRVVLRVVEPPDTPIILDAHGVEIMGSAGPFREDVDDISLQCVVKGGRPQPDVQWWLGSLLLDASLDQVNDTTAVNSLFVKTVTRKLWGAALECRANSSHLTPPATRRVPLSLSLKPLGVRLRSPGGEVLSAGRSHRFTCEAWGSVPAAHITWLLDNKKLKAHDISETQMANSTSSALSLRLRPHDDGRELACRVENPDFPHLEMVDRRRLQVAFAPEATVVLVEPAGKAPLPRGPAALGGASLAAGAAAEELLGPVLREEDSARLRCEVRAYPPPTHIAWFHNGLPLASEAALEGGGDGQPALAAGGRELVLGRVRPRHAGEYECVAVNREGEARSAPLWLRVHYAPRCAPDSRPRRVGVLAGKRALARCRMDAAPEADLNFSWTEKRARGATDRVDGARVVTSGAVSEVSVEAPAEGGAPVELLCYARNSVGPQKEPCVFVIVPAQAPKPPVECALRNGTGGHLEVQCRPGHDGDLPQYFVLEVREQTAAAAAPRPAPPPPLPPATLSDQAQAAAATGQDSAPQHRVELRMEEPRFPLGLLQPGLTYQLAVFAVNDKGRSEPPVLLAGVRAPPSARAGPPQAERGKASEAAAEAEAAGAASAASLQPTPIILAVVIAAAVLLLGVMVATAALLACRRRHPPPPLPPLPLVPLAPAVAAPVPAAAPAPATATVCARAKARPAEVVR